MKSYFQNLNDIFNCSWNKNLFVFYKYWIVFKNNISIEYEKKIKNLQ